MYSDILFDYLKEFYVEGGEDFGEQKEFQDKIKIDKYEILTDEKSKEYDKPKGKYQLVSIPDVLDYSHEEMEKCIDIVSDCFCDMFGKITSKDRILVVGLGNRHISSDSLGAKVVGGINITIENKSLPKVMAICPSVMGLTGIETVEIIEGVISRVEPSHVIIIDSLCAGAVERLGRSIQITNTGICPGGGIGNNRKCIDKKIAKNVFSIGVPLMIFSDTFVSEAFGQNGITIEHIDAIMQNLEKEPNMEEIIKLCQDLKSLLYDPQTENLIVSIKDIDESVKILSCIISESINRALGVDVY